VLASEFQTPGAEYRKPRHRRRRRRRRRRREFMMRQLHKMRAMVH